MRQTAPKFRPRYMGVNRALHSAATPVDANALLVFLSFFSLSPSLGFPHL